MPSKSTKLPKTKKESKPDTGGAKCFQCGTEIPHERVQFLLSTGVSLPNMTCVKHSTTKKRLGIYMGEHGTSQMRVVDKIYNDSVRSVFKKSEHELSDSPDEDEEEKD